jgi:hypothetical protein
MVAYVSRRELGYRPADVDLRLEDVPAEPGRTTWIIVDYRWPKFRELATAGRLEPVDVPNGRPELIRLFRLPPK